MKFEDRDIESLLKLKLSEGQSLAKIAADNRLNPKRLARIAKEAGLRYPHEHQPSERLETAALAVMKESLTYRAASEIYKLSRSAACNG